MRCLLKPIIISELGQVILKPGADLMSLFGDRIMVTRVPPEFRKMPSGALPTVEQQLATDPRFRSFFTHERVLGAAGGPAAMRDWLARGFECQCASTDGYHDKNISVMEYGDHSIRMCWHHQHKYREQTSPMLNKLAEQNVADFVVYRARAHFMFDESHQLTLPELCWWAWVKEVIDLIPEEVAAASLRVAPHSVPAGVKKESDIEHTPAARQIVAEKAKKRPKR